MDRSSYLNEWHSKFGAPQPIVVELVERLIGGTVVAVERLVEGDEYEVHRVNLADGSTVFLRIGPPGTPTSKPYQEARAMELARASGVPVPEVLSVESITTDDGERQAMVVTAAPGRQLGGLLGSLSPTQRRTAMMNLGRVLAMLHSVQMPGLGLPDAQGVWPDPTRAHRRYIANVIADCDYLHIAGLTEDEINQARELLRTFEDVPMQEVPVLCHGDLSPAHIFVDTNLRVCGLIDWGLWNAGAAVDDLADFTYRNDPADIAAVRVGHYGSAADDPALTHAISRSLMMQVIGYLRWLITTGQTDSLEPGVVALRRALANLSASG